MRWLLFIKIGKYILVASILRAVYLYIFSCLVLNESITVFRYLLKHCSRWLDFLHFICFFPPPFNLLKYWNITYITNYKTLKLPYSPQIKHTWVTCFIILPYCWTVAKMYLRYLLTCLQINIISHFYFERG